jgi:hypothetical protein
MKGQRWTFLAEICVWRPSSWHGVLRNQKGKQRNGNCGTAQLHAVGFAIVFLPGHETMTVRLCPIYGLCGWVCALLARSVFLCAHAPEVCEVDICITVGDYYVYF